MALSLGVCRWAVAGVLWVGIAPAQDASSLDAILKRIEKLEQENRAMAEEIRALRSQLGAAQPAAPPVTERLETQERRTDDLAQTKVEAAEKFPVTLEGMVLMNTFLNTQPTGGSENPTVMPATTAEARVYGATLRQTTLGLRYHGPTVAGAKVSGTLNMDFFQGTTASLNHLLRIRTATIQMDWGRSKLMAGQEKPLISPRNPMSLAQVGVDALTNAGNLWLWQPQVRFDEILYRSDTDRITGQVSLYETVEGATPVPAVYEPSFARQRPGLQGRVEWSHRSGERQIFAVAPGFHASDSQVAGTSAPSRIGTFDWLVAPTSRLEWTGLFYKGSNIAHMGALRQGFVILGPGNVLPVRGTGGWSQLSYRATDRLTLNVYAGQHDDVRRDLRFGGMDKNQAYAANAIYRLVQNVLIGFETAQVRTTHTTVGVRKNTHYDLAVAYLF